MMSETERASWKIEVARLEDDIDKYRDGYDLPIPCRCICCGQQHTVWTTREAYQAWNRRGVYIQDAMPFLSASDREWLLSGICPHCFDIACQEEEDV